MVEQALEVEPFLLNGEKRIVLLQSFSDVSRVVKLGTYPMSVMSFCGLIGRSSAAEGIEDDVARLRRDKNGSLGNHQFQFIHTRPNLEFRVTVRRCVGPEIRQIHAFRVHLVSVAAVIPDLLAAVPAFFHRQPDFVEYTRRAAGEIKKRVMCRIQLLATRICVFHGQRNPMSEIQPFSHNRSKLYCKFRCSVEEECASGLQNPATFLDPYPAPIQILVARHRVVVTILVVL